MDQAISPLFELLEPFLFIEHPPVPLALLEKVRDVLHRVPHLCGGGLRKFGFLDCPDDGFSDWFAELCSIVDNEYDVLARYLGIPLRSSAYRKERYHSSYRYTTDKTKARFIRYFVAGLLSGFVVSLPILLRPLSVWSWLFVTSILIVVIVSYCMYRTSSRVRKARLYNRAKYTRETDRSKKTQNPK